ncbi:macrophage mannose receptor 1-like [Siphateles boraxobius]|uniref:macrophage mannose receptor 1-like n=1 Tax=Siphateles boraxobius TaxID=180520 RepID=UPI004063C478
MLLLSVMLLLWGVPLSSASGRLRRFQLISNKMLINEARNACRSNYTDLVTIYNETENMDLVNILNVSGWIGANSCKWSNGDPATFIKYSGTFNEEKCCGAVNTGGGWGCVNCSETKMYFMCYDKGNGQESDKYWLIRESRNWFEAQLYCREHHTDLVSIRNEMENERVKKAVNGSDSFWIGLQYNYSLDWVDGGHSGYTQNSSSRACFTYFLKQHSLMKKNKDNCSALCYKSSIHVSTDKMSWEEALNYCDTHTDTAGLLIIQSENDQIETDRELERRKISGPVWVGLRQSRLFGFWIWINGLNARNWSNWKEGSPPEHQISLHCGAIEKVDGQYKWCDKDCRKNYTVLCEGK